MTLHRLSAKLFLQNPVDLDIEAVTAVFHEWIQQSKAPGMLIDVADYRHMVDGPGIVLVGSDVDYAVDLTDGRPGVMHLVKRDLPESIGQCVRMAVHGALVAADLSEQAGLCKVATGEMQLMFRDRLNTPNDQATFDRLHGDVAKVLSQLYGGAGLTVDRAGSADRRPLCMNVTAPAVPDLATLIQRSAASAGA